MKANGVRGAKKATNLSIDQKLLKAARRRHINLSATLEAALLAELRARDASDWLAENEDAIDSYAAHVQKRGVFSDHFRRF